MTFALKTSFVRIYLQDIRCWFIFENLTMHSFRDCDKKSLS
jgi:hypothetical protein